MSDAGSDPPSVGQSDVTMLTPSGVPLAAAQAAAQAASALLRRGSHASSFGTEVHSRRSSMHSTTSHTSTQPSLALGRSQTQAHYGLPSLILPRRGLSSSDMLQHSGASQSTHDPRRQMAEAVRPADISKALKQFAGVVRTRSQSMLQRSASQSTSHPRLASISSACSEGDDATSAPPPSGGTGVPHHHHREQPTRTPSILAQLRQLDELNALLAEREEEIIDCVTVGERLLDELHIRDRTVRELRVRLGEPPDDDPAADSGEPFGIPMDLVDDMAPHLDSLDAAQAYLEAAAVKDTSFATMGDLRMQAANSAPLHAMQHLREFASALHDVQLAAELEEEERAEREQRDLLALMSTASSVPNAAALSDHSGADAPTTPAEHRSRRAELADRVRRFDPLRLLCTSLGMASALHSGCVERDAEVQHLKRLCNNNSDKVAAARALEELEEARDGLRRQEDALRQEKDDMSWCQRETLQHNAREIAEISLQIGRLQEDCGEARAAEALLRLQLSELESRSGIREDATHTASSHLHSLATSAAVSEGSARRACHASTSEVHRLTAALDASRSSELALQKRCGDLSESLATRDMELQRLKEHTASLAGVSAEEAASLRTQAEALAGQLEAEREQRDARHATLLRSLEGELEELGAQLAELSRENREKDGEAAALEVLLQEAREAGDAWQGEMGQQQSRAASLEAENTGLRERVARLSGRLAELDGAERDNEAKGALIDELRDIARSCTERTASAEAEARHTAARHTALCEMLAESDPLVLRELQAADLCEVPPLEKLRALTRIAHAKAQSDSRHDALRASLLDSRQQALDAEAQAEASAASLQDAEAALRAAESRADSLARQVAERGAAVAEACTARAELCEAQAAGERLSREAGDALQRAERAEERQRGLQEALAASEAALVGAQNSSVESGVHAELLAQQLERTQGMLEERDARCFSLESEMRRVEAELCDVESRHDAVARMTSEAQRRGEELEGQASAAEARCAELAAEVERLRLAERAAEVDPLAAKMLSRAQAFRKLEETKGVYADKLEVYQASVGMLVEKTERDCQLISPSGVAVPRVAVAPDPMHRKFERLQSQLERLDLDLRDSQVIHRETETEMQRTQDILKGHLAHSKSQIVAVSGRGYTARILNHP